MSRKPVAEPDEWIEPGESYCPKCGGEVGSLPDGSYKCIAAVGRFIGCGWKGQDTDMPVKEGGEP